MIDLHFHCLPGIDDGPRDWDEAVALCKAAYAEGTTTIVATPHVLRDAWLNEDPGARDRLLEELNARLEGKPVILPGCEYFFSSDAIELWQQPHHQPPEILHRSSPDEPPPFFADPDSEDDPQSSPQRSSIANPPSSIINVSPLTALNRGHYLLVEFPATRIPPQAEAVFHEMSLIGLKPVIAHPERNQTFVESPERLARFIELGALAQVTAGSLLGHFGKQALSAATEFFRRGLVHVIASDAHSTRRRPPQLTAARERVKATWGTEAESALFDINPAALIRDEAIES